MSPEARAVVPTSRVPNAHLLHRLPPVDLAQENFQVKSDLVNAIRARIADRSSTGASHAIELMRRLRLADIDRIEVIEQVPGRLQVDLIPSPHHPHRNREEWFTIVLRSLRESIGNSMALFALPPMLLREGGRFLREGIESAARMLVRDGAVFARSCLVTARFGELQREFVCMEVSGGVHRWGGRIVALEEAIGRRLGVPVHLLPAEIPDSRRRDSVTERLSRHRYLKGVPKFLKEHDDPKPKLLRDPVDLRSLEWWAYDGSHAKRREDIQAVVDTPVGPYLIVAFPTFLWSDRFHSDLSCRVMFCGALVGENGMLSRMRVGEGLTSEPIMMDRDRLEWGTGKLKWDLFLKRMKEVLAPRVYSDAGAIRSVEHMVGASMLFAQEVLVSCLRLRPVPYVVHLRYQEGGAPQVLRGDELVPGEHVVPLKARHRGGLLNQEQLHRTLRRKAPLGPSRFQSVVRG